MAAARTQCFHFLLVCGVACCMAPYDLLDFSAKAMVLHSHSTSVHLFAPTRGFVKKGHVSHDYKISISALDFCIRDIILSLKIYSCLFALNLFCCFKKTNVVFKQTKQTFVCQCGIEVKFSYSLTTNAQIQRLTICYVTLINVMDIIISFPFHVRQTSCNDICSFIGRFISYHNMWQSIFISIGIVHWPYNQRGPQSTGALSIAT